MTSVSVEEYLHEKIRNRKPTEIFYSVNQYINEILQINRIQINGITRCDDRIRDIIKYNLDNYTKIYIMGEPYLYKEAPKKFEIIEDVNILKYISMYPDEIIIMRDTLEITQNKMLKEKLVTEYKTALFLCPYDTNIVGIEGHQNFEKSYHKYLNTIDKIYVINGNYYDYIHIIGEVATGTPPPRPEYIYIDVPLFLQTYPQYNAFYRAPVNETRSYLNKYYNFSKYVQLDENIFLGDDSYKYCPIYLERNHIYTIINVAYVNPLEQYKYENILARGYNYLNIPIIEDDEEVTKNTENMYKAAELLHDLVDCQNKKVYIHCLLGMNRSPAVLILYYMIYRGYTLFDAYKKIALVRFVYTMPCLFDILYNEARVRESVCVGASARARTRANAMTSDPATETALISPLKICAHDGFNRYNSLYLFALYDYLHCEAAAEMEEVWKDVCM